MNPDFESLVELAMDGNPFPLQDALRRLSARRRRKLTYDEYPECVRAMFATFAPFAQPNGMPKRGRALKDPEQERLRLIYRSWVESLIRESYEEKLQLYQWARMDGYRERVGNTSIMIDVEGKPSARALEEIGEEFGVGPDAIKKMLRKANKKGTPR